MLKVNTVPTTTQNTNTQKFKVNNQTKLPIISTKRLIHNYLVKNNLNHPNSTTTKPQPKPLTQQQFTSLKKQVKVSLLQVLNSNRKNINYSWLNVNPVTQQNGGQWLYNNLINHLNKYTVIKG